MRRKEHFQILEETLLDSYMRIEDPNESIRALGDINLHSPIFTNFVMMKMAQRKLLHNIVKNPPPDSTQCSTDSSHTSNEPALKSPSTGEHQDSASNNFKCTICGEISVNNEDFTNHILTTHGSAGELKNLKKEFESFRRGHEKLKTLKKSLEQELQSTKDKLRNAQFQCSICHAQQQSKQKLEDHVNTMHQLVGEGKHLVDTLRKEKDDALKEKKM